MKKSDLKTGHVVKIRDGETFIVLKDTIGLCFTNCVDILKSKNNKFIVLHDYNNNLNYRTDSSLDVIEVRTFDAPYLMNDNYNYDKLNLKWKRDTNKYITANHFGSTQDYTWIAKDDLDLKIGDIVEVETSKGNQLVQIKEITDVNKNKIHKKVIRKVVI